MMSPASPPVNRWSRVWRWFIGDRGPIGYFGQIAGFVVLSAMATEELRPMLQVSLKGGSPPLLWFVCLWLCIAILVALAVKNGRRRLRDLGWGGWHWYLVIGVLSAGLEAALILRESSQREFVRIYLLVQLPLILGVRRRSPSDT